MRFQWLGNRTFNPKGTFLPGWLDPVDLSFYFQPRPVSRKHAEFVGSDEGVQVTKDEIITHGFHVLTDTNRLTQNTTTSRPVRPPRFLLVSWRVACPSPSRSLMVRPLCCGDPLRRLVAKCFCLGAKDEISRVFKGRNFGVGCPGGVEVVAHSLRDCLSSSRGSGQALLKIDFKNAFNSVDRSSFLARVAEVFPRLSLVHLVLRVPHRPGLRPRRGHCLNIRGSTRSPPGPPVFLPGHCSPRG